MGTLTRFNADPAADIDERTDFVKHKSDIILVAESPAQRISFLSWNGDIAALLCYVSEVQVGAE
jgi:hypothetical protein